MSSLINIDLLPNFESDDFEIIKKLLKNSGHFNLEESEKYIRESLEFYFPNTKIYFFNSARSALTFSLKILENKGEIITQAFSCLVVPNAIKFAGFKPIYVDIDESFNINIHDLKRKITKETKAIIIQNTFGIPAKITEILEIAQQNNLLIIENLTHSLGAKYNNTYLGNFGDISLLSFNRNKVISSIIGGALIIRNKKIEEIIKDSYNKLPDLEDKEINKILSTAKILYRAREHYNFLVKIYLKFLRKKGVVMDMISYHEKLGQEPKNYLCKFPKVLFPLLENQLKKLEKFNQHRKEIAQIYIQAGLMNFKINEHSEPIFLRFPFLTEEKIEILRKAKKENIYLGDWYDCVLAPCPKLENFGYQSRSCPYAEMVTKKIINLPTYIGMSFEKTEKIIKLIKK